MASLDFSVPGVRRTWAGRLRAPINEGAWDKMVRELFAWQFAQVPAYRRLCVAHGVTPESCADWRKIPAVPQQLFKLENLFCHGGRRPGAIYESSGTTTGQPGRQLLLGTDIYRDVCTEGARRAGLFEDNPELHFLVPSPREAPRSSLSAMFGFWQKQVRQTSDRFWVKENAFNFARLRSSLQTASRRGRSVGLAGTAFSFVHLLDAWSDEPVLRLPRGSWLLETGGFKGRSREVAKPELYAAMACAFGVSDASIWNEYGMSELSSQAYARGTQGLHFPPPWARVLVWDAGTNREVPVGARGLVRWIDLANVDSVMALQTLDVAERTAQGFRLIGRLPRTEPRGCSLSTEDLAMNHRS